MTLDLKTTFNTDAELYYASRPRYPAALIQKLITDAHLTDESRLLEIGPGTGQATTQLAAHGYAITAIELGASLAHKAREVLAAYPRVNIITGAFEDVNIADAQYDVVYAATAFHWIKPAVKFVKTHRILVPGGYLAVIHTEHVSDEQGDTFFSASMPIYAQYTDPKNSVNSNAQFQLPKTSNLKPAYYDESLFTLKQFATFPYAVTYTAQEYVQLLATYSPHIALPLPTRTAFMKAIKSLISDKFGGSIQKHYVMTLTLLQKN